ncbi:hypothetical protein D5R81_11720 [Parashewanella spongiae]|uniref:Uncharacterized protein n=1 Tax=Parashewanella spongiae TaxID=342950 RepID=A0A3A6TD65_9GAMM|nr:hypothetical protein [Parashewanella spongiae]MCL1077593.1 hypothetical protein [Parashewanella spongiae]RJY13179.1 hypothetical protein D5R81_11720 [Parashewanella spongiae]
MNYGKPLLFFVAFLAFGVVIAHMSCIYLGEQCYSAQMAPQILIESAKAGTLVAPVATIIVSFMFFIVGLYALSSARVITNLPFLNAAVITISVLCIIRGILPLQLWLRKPELMPLDGLIVGIIWLVSGVIFFAGHRKVKKELKRSHLNE